MTSPSSAARALQGAHSSVVPGPVVAEASFAGPPRSGARHYVEGADGVWWTVYEMAADTVPGRRAASCLVFDSPACVRRVWSFPAEWRALADDALLAVSQGR